MNENQEDHGRETLDESIASLRDSYESAAAAPAAIGWHTEQWLRRREQTRSDMTEMLSAESIRSEMQIRDDVPQLLAHLARLCNGAEAA